MVESLIWAVFAVLIGIGGWTMNPIPPDYTITRWCFLLAALIFLARIGWWIGVDHSANKIQMSILAFIVFGFIGGLFVVSMQWISERERQHIEQKKTATNSQVPIVIQAPIFGNLKNRAIQLSEQIMEDLYRHGWRVNQGNPFESKYISGMPRDPEKQIKWKTTRSNVFRFFSFDKVQKIRDEFEKFHILDQNLESFLKLQNIQLSAKQINPKFEPIFIQPDDIESVAESLKSMANQIKD